MVLNEEKGEVLVVQDRQLVYAHFSTFFFIYQLKSTFSYCINAKELSSQTMNIIC